MADYVGTEKENIIVGNGSTELISLFIQIEHPKKAMILGPTYSEYEREVSLGGGTTPSTIRSRRKAVLNWIPPTLPQNWMIPLIF